MSYQDIINNIKNFKDLSSLDFWGYYGAFILGKNNLVNNSDFVENLKYHIQSNNFGSYNLFQYIIQSHFLNNYNLIFIDLLFFFFKTSIYSTLVSIRKVINL